MQDKRGGDHKLKHFDQTQLEKNKNRVSQFQPESKATLILVLNLAWVERWWCTSHASLPECICVRSGLNPEHGLKNKQEVRAPFEEPRIPDTGWEQAPWNKREEVFIIPPHWLNPSGKQTVRFVAQVRGQPPIACIVKNTHILRCCC